MIIKIEIINDDPEVKTMFKAFEGDELTSAEQQAIIFLKQKDEEKEIF